MTAEQSESLVTDELRAQRDVWSEPTRSFPVSVSDIRKWAIAVYWPEPPPQLYWDEEYAKATRWGGLVAPVDFNPFAWPVNRPPPRAGQESATSAGVGQRRMNGGRTETFHEPLRPGDVVEETSALIGWRERETSLGPTLFTETETRWTNQNGELVKRKVQIGIIY